MILIVTIISLLFANSNEVGGKISAAEKTFITDLIDRSTSEIENHINNLSEDKWTYKNDADSWSPSQIVHHILDADKALTKQIEKALSSPAQVDADYRANDGWLISKIADRGRKVQTPLNGDPANITQKEALKELKEVRAKLKIILNKGHALRHHIGRSPYGPADTYQLFIVVAVHGLRHVAQIEEQIQ